MLRRSFALWIVGALCGCTSVIHEGGQERLPASAVRIWLPPFHNATNDEHAGRALTELTASALLERGIPLAQSETLLTEARSETAPGPDGLYRELARRVNATHLLIGTVHEYRYKTDLDGDPAVGLTLRLVDAQDGRTVWQGSSSKVNVMFASLSSTAQAAVKNLVDRMPLSK